MKEELDNKLVEKYPIIFQNRNGDMRTTAMCWGFDCGDGWYDIIDALCANIQGRIDNIARMRMALLKSNPYNVTVPEEVPQVIATQVKEKFGGLRFYYDGGDDAVLGMVRMAESMSTRTCEICGKPGKLIGGGWLYTACEEHNRDKVNMKIAINTCYGGFSLSEEFWARYAQAKGFTLVSKDSVITKLHYKNTISDENFIDDRDFDRDDETVIKIIEEIGCKAASGKFSDVKIVEIPDDVEWEIKEYDGKEWVAEKHRIWT